MARQSEDPLKTTEQTDEMPALSAATIRRFELTGQSGGADPMHGLDASLEGLRAALDLAEERWLRLETRLEEQDRVISRLQAELFTRSASAGGSGRQTEHRVPELTEVVAAPATRRGSGGSPEQAFLERIADLEAYIAGRADRWRAMEADLDGNGRRIAELESELRQRIDREQNLTQRLHAAGDRSEALRDQLRRMHLRLESLDDGEK